MIYSAKDIAQALRDLRGSKSRDEVAKAWGVTRSAVGMYEQGRRIPDDRMKVTIAAYYCTTVGALFFGEKSNNMLSNDAN